MFRVKRFVIGLDCYDRFLLYRLYILKDLVEVLVGNRDVI